MLDAITLHSVEFGKSSPSSSTPVLILHGLFGSSRNWQTLAQKLSAKHHVFTLDLRNHGQSPHCETMSYPQMAADVVRFMDDHQIDKARIIGHSMGGKTAMSMALASPQRVAQLVVVDIAPVAYRHNYDELLGNLQNLDLSQITRRSIANKMLGDVLDDDELRLFLLQKPCHQTR